MVCPPPAFLTASSIWILLFSPFLQMLWYYLKVTTDTILDSVSTAVVRISHVRYQSEANEFFFPAIPRHVTKYRIPGVFIDNQSWRVYFWTPDISQESPKLYWKIVLRIGKMTHLTIKNGIFKKFQKSKFFYGPRFSQPKYHIPRWKNVTGSLKQKKY